MRSLPEALGLIAETADVDFKSHFEPTVAEEFLEIIKDIVAMANSGGGFIIFGLDDSGAPLALEELPLANVDPAEIGDKIHKYTDVHFAAFEITEAEKNGTRLSVISVGAADYPLVFTKAGNYQLEGGRQKNAFQVGTAYFRHGAKSEPGCTDDIRRAFERLLESTKRSWLDGLAKIAEAPRGSVITVGPPEATANGSAAVTTVRLVDDPNAPVMHAVKVDQTHPFRAKEVIAAVNERLAPRKQITSHTILCIRRVYQIQKKPSFCYTMHYASPQYSSAFVEWIVAEFESNQSFFEETKAKFDAIKAAKS